MGDWERQRDIEQEGQRAALVPPLSYDRPYPYRTQTGEHGLRWEPTPAEIVAKQVAAAIASDRDGKVRQALIDLGWTPPEGSR